MKRIMLLTSLFAMMAASMSLKAQGITITLDPGWNWIGYPYPESVDLGTVFGDFEPMPDDIIESLHGYSEYITGVGWFGAIQSTNPGWGYMYYSNRMEPVSVVLHAPASPYTVTTAEPTDITYYSATCGGSVAVAEGDHVFLRGVCWSTDPNPTVDDNHTTDETGIGSWSVQVWGLTMGTTYHVRAYAVSDNGLKYGDDLSFTTLNIDYTDHDYVDLGLPSGTLWATCNVGATVPEGYGDYFAWGETSPKGYYDWGTYQYCNGNDDLDPQLTKYCSDEGLGYNGFTDDLITLLPEDDAATTNWGIDWRMPTGEEWQELVDNTTNTWTTRNGVNGTLFTASNGNSLFLPAGGVYYEGDSPTTGGGGRYWSSSLYDNPIRSIAFGNDDDGFLDIWGARRYIGYSVRPVRSFAQNTAPTGAINGKFTINEAGNQVYFAQGNLQYVGSAAEPYWKFAENQWDCLGTTTGQNSNDQNVDRDLFGWGTSGWDSGNTCFHPWDIFNSTGSSYGPIGANNLTGSYVNSDWGVYNSISNGGDQPNQWRTPTKDEWGYVFDTRTTASGIRYAKANVNDVNGTILLPDDWSANYYSLSDTNTEEASYSSNIITASEWATLEQHGAVFLPATGYRFGTSVKNVGSHGYYWSSSFVNGTYAYGVYFFDSNLNPQDCSNRTYGRGVRLITASEN